jgi:uroporphyrinogen III methyltransferase/synthase
MTVRAVECLRQADVILYDSLVNPQILEHAQPAAEKVCLGRPGRGRPMAQKEIHTRLIDEARRGRVVVSLKGGDPTLLSRGAEEARAVADAGVPLEIVPGITPAVAASRCAGIPVMYPEVASAVAFITGQDSRGQEAANRDLAELAKFPGTLVFQVEVTTDPQWSAALVDAGKPPDTPTAVVWRCSWPDQQVVHCRLGDLAEVLASRKPQLPAMAIVGPVVGTSETLAWLGARPLLGQTVLVTRPHDQGQATRRRIADLGATVFIQEAIEISDPPDWQPVDDVIARLDQYHWILFSSANGVRYLLDRVVKIGYDLRQLGRVKLGAIGPATAEMLQSYRLRADVQPDEFRAEGLAEALQDEARGKRFLLARASRGRAILAANLTAAGAEVDEVVVYTSRDVTSARAEVAEALRSGRIDWTTVTSSAIARSLVGLFGHDLNRTKLVSISPLTTESLRTLGHEPALEAVQYTTDGVIDAIVHTVAGKPFGGD